MPATATARKTANRAARPRRAPRAAAVRATRPAPRPAPRVAPRLVPVAVGRTAVAVGGIADSGAVLRLTRSRLWIGLLGTLLVGIVALNVVTLSFNARSSKTAALADQLRSENSALGTQISDGLSNERLQTAAARLGLVVPEPGTILYLAPSPGDAAAAAQRLRKGQITLGSSYVAPVVPVVAPLTEDQIAATTEPATETVAPTEAAVTEPDPATATTADTTTTTAPAAGGITVP